MQLTDHVTCVDWINFATHSIEICWWWFFLKESDRVPILQRKRKGVGADQWEGPVGGAWEGPLPRRGEWSCSSGRFRTSVVRSTRRLSEPCVKWCPSDGVGYCAAAVKFHRSSPGVCVSESQISGFGGLWFLTEIHLQLLCHSPSGTSWNCKVRPWLKQLKCEDAHTSDL